MSNFIPKNTKFTKFQKKKFQGRVSSRLINFQRGCFGLKVKQNCYLSSRQLETIKMLLVKATKKIGRYWLRVFPSFCLTAKPLEIRMGKGKGYVDKWVCKVSGGSFICEISGISEVSAFNLLKKISSKLPVETLLLKKKI